MTETRVGISGWTYPPWRKIFYPKDLPQKRELEYASRMLNSIEINGSFYSLHGAFSYQAWYDATPAGFLFSIKGGRYITHLRRLREIETPLANFFASGLLALKEKLGPILWQFPPNFQFDPDKLENFFKLLPRDTKAAAALACKHDAHLKTRALTTTDVNRPLRFAVEIRHPTFQTPAFIDLLRRHNIALVIADTAGKWPYMEDITADFIYARLHGDKELYASGYSAEALDRWEGRLRAWQCGKQLADAKVISSQKETPRAKQRDVYIYFDNDVKVKAPFDAMALADRLGPRARGTDRNEKAEALPELPKSAATLVRTRWPGVKARR